MKRYISRGKKPQIVHNLTVEALDILDCIGMPLHRHREKYLRILGCVVLAFASVKDKWSKATDTTFFKISQLIPVLNVKYMEELTIYQGEVIVQNNLKELLAHHVVIRNETYINKMTKLPHKGYFLHPEFQKLIVHYGQTDWAAKLQAYNENKPPVVVLPVKKRNPKPPPPELSEEEKLALETEERILLIRAIQEKFLTRFVKVCEVIYVNNQTDNLLPEQEEALKEWNLQHLSIDELPDVIAFNRKKNTLFFIESLRVSLNRFENRTDIWKDALKDVDTKLIFVTAFLTTAQFRRSTPSINWNTEIWVADQPYRLIRKV